MPSAAAALWVIVGVTLVVPATVSSTPDTSATVSANRAPYWPSPRKTRTSTSFQYDDTGNLYGAVTKITLVTKPVDPDRDRLRYAWRATNGRIQGNGTSATWKRIIWYGDVKPGTVTVVASDGRGGKATAKFLF
jgi:hypothetical protein